MPNMPAGWRPEDGDTLDGRVIELGRGWSDQAGEYYPIITIETEDGERVNVHAFHAILKNALMDKQPHTGDRIIITYHGKRPTRADANRMVAIYTLETPDREQDAGKFWNGLGSQPRRSRAETDTPAIPEYDVDEQVGF